LSQHGIRVFCRQNSFFPLPLPLVAGLLSVFPKWILLLLGVIIFGFVRFLPKKPNQILKKIKPKLVQTDWFRFSYFRTKTKTQPAHFQFGSVILY
jgi:hypothetical protein